jgi:hypothetical protein
MTTKKDGRSAFEIKLFPVPGVGMALILGITLVKLAFDQHFLESSAEFAQQFYYRLAVETPIYLKVLSLVLLTAGLLNNIKVCLFLFFFFFSSCFW